MCKIVGVVLLVALSGVMGLPAKTKDTAVVESIVREARAAVPSTVEDLFGPDVKAAYIHTYGDGEDDDGDVQGYERSKNDEGKDGYKHFDSYHKKDGDKYGHESHTEYGKSDGAKYDSGSRAKRGKSGGKRKSNKKRRGEGDGEETKSAYKVVEDINEGKGRKANALEDYEGGFYADSGDFVGYEGEGGGDYEGGEIGPYIEAEGDDGDSESIDEGGDYEEGESESYDDAEDDEEESDDYDY